MPKYKYKDYLWDIEKSCWYNADQQAFHKCISMAPLVHPVIKA